MKTKILFVNDEMVMGGVARILNTLLAKLEPELYDIDLLVLHPHGELLKEVPDYVNIISSSNFFATVDIPLKEAHGHLFNKLRLLFYMKTGLIKKKIIKERKKILTKKYDVEFAAKEGFCTIFTSYSDAKIKLNWIQVDYLQENYSKHHMPLLIDALKRIDLNIACSETVKNSFNTVFKVDNIEVIHNPIDEDRIRHLAEERADLNFKTTKIHLITVARFHPQKALDRLLRIYNKVKDYYELMIIGDGPLKEELFILAKELNIFDDIIFSDIKENPYPEISEADLFIMTSLYEGYPTITIETLLSATPVLTTDVAGVTEQITKEEYGWIVDNNEESLYNKLNELKNNKALLTEYKHKLKDYHYENDHIIKRYKDIFGGL